jgi:hypothetical protein
LRLFRWGGKKLQAASRLPVSAKASTGESINPPKPLDRRSPPSGEGGRFRGQDHVNTSFIKSEN